MAHCYEKLISVDNITVCGAKTSRSSRMKKRE